MNEINLIDKFMIDDSHSNIRGFVVLEKDGKIIFARENLIVKSGRKLIKDAILSASNTLDKNRFSLFIGKNDNFPVADEDEKTIANYTIISLVSSNIVESSDSDSSIYIKIEKQLTVGVGKDVQEGIYNTAGLIYNDGGTNKLFSRVSFPDTGLDANTTYNLTYFIYF